MKNNQAGPIYSPGVRPVFYILLYDKLR